MQGNGEKPIGGVVFSNLKQLHHIQLIYGHFSKGFRAFTNEMMIHINETKKKNLLVQC